MKEIVLFLCLFPFILFSQQTQLPERPSFTANVLEVDPILDGNVLGDEVWKNIPSIKKNGSE